MSVRGDIPDATVARLPVYLRSLVAISDRGALTVSSGELAEVAGVNPAKLRKDLSYLGTFGTRGVGYPVNELMMGIEGALGLSTDHKVAIVGLGNLGRALAAYGGFSERGFQTVALLDADPSLVGTSLAGHEVEHVDDLEEVVTGRGVDLAVLAVPAAAAQDVADRLVASGVTGLLNFAPANVDVPEHVHVRKVDLSVELQILSFYEQLGSRGGSLG